MNKSVSFHYLSLFLFGSSKLPTGTVFCHQVLYCSLTCSLNHNFLLIAPSQVISVCLPICTRTNHYRGRSKWPSAIRRQTAFGLCVWFGHQQVTREPNVFHDTKFPYRFKVLLKQHSTQLISILYVLSSVCSPGLGNQISDFFVYHCAHRIFVFTLG